ncbi:MAG: DUF2281 domain-containing protein [Flavobacteriales bacterium]
MSSADLFVKIESLPADLRKQVIDFVEFLLKRKSAPEPSADGSDREKPVAGLLKGKIWIADDFDEPLDDFKDYME